MVRDADAVNELVDKALALVKNDEQLKSLSENVFKLAEKDSADRIADIIIENC